MKWLAFLLVMFPSAALAISPCLSNPQLPRELVVNKLSNENQQHLFWQGMIVPPSNKYLFELFLSEHGSWTLVMTTVNSLSCAIGGGDHWLHHDIKELFN